MFAKTSRHRCPASNRDSEIGGGTRVCSVGKAAKAGRRKALWRYMWHLLGPREALEDASESLNWKTVLYCYSNDITWT